MTNSGYDKQPYVEATEQRDDCCLGWDEIASAISARVRDGRFVVCVECYPGVDEDTVARQLTSRLGAARCLRASRAWMPAAEIDRVVRPLLGDDPVFGRMNTLEIEDHFDPAGLSAFRAELEQSRGLTVVVGYGASAAAGQFDLLVYAGLARWEIQRRQRRNGHAAAAYKRGYFVDWRVADRLRTRLYGRIDFYLDTNDEAAPKMIPGALYLRGLATTVRRPFRVVPFFDPGPWGGQWMRRRMELPDGPPNYAWCFDCVPEENSLLLAFGDRRVEVPAIDVVMRHPQELLGGTVYQRFGAEFPIRFDLLDTMEGGNLSLQVHPKADYIREQFGMAYTQDESYYLLDAGQDARVFLGLRDDVDRDRIATDLRRAQQNGTGFDAAKYVNCWPPRKHDHFSIPAGTIHCSGANSMVLEISATPYIFTFKLWDWGRLGLDGFPRPIHLEHGLANIEWSRTREWVRSELIGRTAAVASGDGWREERTGLHRLEFIETRRHWFTKAVTHNTQGNLNVLNLVEGDAALVESPGAAFAPFEVHYAETFIVPAAVGPYTIRPLRPVRAEMATLKAWVRPVQDS